MKRNVYEWKETIKEYYADGGDLNFTAYVEEHNKHAEDETYMNDTIDLKKARDYALAEILDFDSDQLMNTKSNISLLITQ